MRLNEINQELASRLPGNAAAHEGEGCLTRRWSRLAMASCGMVHLLAASCSTFSLGGGADEALQGYTEFLMQPADHF